MVDKAHWFALIDSELQRAFAQTEQGLDIAPAQRHQIEGFIAAAHAEGIELNELLKFSARNAPQNCSIQIDAERKTLQLDIWQLRAPVFPSTTD